VSDQLPQSTVLVRMAQDRYQFGRATTGEPFAVPIEGPHVARMLRGDKGSLRAELAATFAEERGRTPSSAALADALLVIEGLCQREAPTQLGLRVAGDLQRVVLDLGTEDGAVAVVEPGQWRVEEHSPLLFRRTQLSAPLPVPSKGGRVDDLRTVINVSDETWPLVVGWMIAAIVPGIPHPILHLQGEQGIGKSTAGGVLASLVDPSPAPLRSSPRDEEAWAVAAAGSWVVGIDNVSTITPWFSDALCRAVTGDGLVRRKLYTDSEVTILAIRRCVLLTSIDAGALRGDLADRLLPVELERLSPGQRVEDHDLAATFAKAHPSILGGLLDLLAAVLKVHPRVRPDRLPRMADFGRLLACVDEVTGSQSLDAYTAVGKRLMVEVVEGDPVAAAVRRFVVDGGHDDWEGTPAELLDLIRPEHPPKGWPADATRLGGRLRRVAPALATVGVFSDVKRANGRRMVVLSTEPFSAASSAARASVSAARNGSAALELFDKGPVQANGSDASDASDAQIPTPSSVVVKGEEGATKGLGISASTASTAALSSNGSHPTDADVERWAAEVDA
jgi:hypothetical protein